MSATTISRAPRGLYSLLGLRDMGAVPRELQSQIVATIDLKDFLLLDQEREPQQNRDFSAIGNQLYFTVPPGELWYVHAFGVRSATLLAGETIGIGIGIQLIPGAEFVPYSRAVTETAGGMAMVSIDAALWLPPGASIGIQCVRIVTPNPFIATAGTGIVSKFRV